MTVDELLSQLKDIHQPVEPGWWPLASGWWWLLFLLSLILLSAWFLRKRRQALKPVKFAANELESIKQQYRLTGDAQQLASDLSTWLKKVSIFAYPKQSIAGLTGQRWLEFLDRSSHSTDFSAGDGQVFATMIYRKDPAINAEKLTILCENWLTRIKSEIINSGQD